MKLALDEARKANQITMNVKSTLTGKTSTLTTSLDDLSRRYSIFSDKADEELSEMKKFIRAVDIKAANIASHLSTLQTLADNLRSQVAQVDYKQSTADKRIIDLEKEVISASKAAEHAYEMMDRIEPQFSMQTEFYDKEISKIKHQGQKHNEKRRYRLKIRLMSTSKC